MPCPTSIDTTPQTSPKSFDNWARRFRFTSHRAYRPSTKGEIVEIIRQTEDDPRGRVKWMGSRWSFMRTFETEDVIIESDNLAGLVEINRSNRDPRLRRVLTYLNLTDEAAAKLEEGRLVHVKGGTKIFNVNRLLHGLPMTTNTDTHVIPGDESSLTCTDDSRAMPTLGGSGGQAIAGAISTGTHGGDIRVRPLADLIAAIHLIGPGGQEWWIERSDGITAGSEEETRAAIELLTTTFDDAETEICGDIIVRKDDDFFNAIAVALGRMGFVYSLVLEVERAYKLTELRREETWETFRDTLRSRPLFEEATSAIHYLNILIMPFADGDGNHVCKIAHRLKSDGDCASLPADEEDAPDGGPDIFGALCRLSDARVLLPALLAVLGILVGVAGGLLASIGPLLAIPIVGWILAAVPITALVAVTAAIVVVTGLIGYLTVGGRMTVREVFAAVSDVATRLGMGDLIISMLTALFNSAYPVTNADGSPYRRTNFSWKIMDTYGYGPEEFCSKVDSMDFAFDPFAMAAGGAPVYFRFIDAVLAVFEDLRRRNITIAGNLAVRYSAGTRTLLGMSKYPTTCHIEIAALRDFPGNSEFVERVQALAKEHGGVPGWGQLFNHYDGRDIRALHGDQLTTWREVLTTLIREGAGKDSTFSNPFTQTYLLEPWEDTRIRSFTLTITVGDDHLADTAWPFRNERSEDFVIVRFTDGTEREEALNRGELWQAHTTHARTVGFPEPGILLSTIDAIRIRHEAAGPDFAADNWTMNRVVITVTTTTGETREIFEQSGSPVFQFQKNANQIWEHLISP